MMVGRTRIASSPGRRWALAGLAVAWSIAVVTTGAGPSSADAGPEGATGAPPVADAVVPRAGPNPTFLVAPNDGVDDLAGRAAVDGRGSTFVTTSSVPLVEVHANGSTSHLMVIEGTGSISSGVSPQPPAIAVSPTEPDVEPDVDPDIYLAGVVEGDVALAPPGFPPTVLNGGEGTSFLIKTDVSGHVQWARTFGGPDVRVSHVEVADGMVVVAGQLEAPLTLGDLPTTAAGDDAAFLAGFDPDTAEPGWVTELAPLPSATFDDIDLYDVESDDDSVAAVGRVGAGVHVTGGGQDVTRTCPGPHDCDILYDIDGATGTPLLVAATDSGDDGWTTHVDPNPAGYAVLREDRAVPGHDWVVDVQQLDPAGAPVWSRRIHDAESLEQDADLTTDSSGEILVALSLYGQVQLGSGADAVTVGTPGSAGYLLAEYTADGYLDRTTTGVDPGLPSYAALTVAVDPNDGVRFIGDRNGPMSFGSGDGALQLTDDRRGVFVASFPPNRHRPTTFTPINPVRALDSRTATGGWSSSPLLAGIPRPLWIGGAVTGLSPQATAVVVNITATDVAVATFITAWPYGSPQPVASNLNLLPGETRSNLATVALGHEQSILLGSSNGSVNLVVDVVGLYETNDTGDRFHPVTPTRLLDSRIPGYGFQGTLDQGTPRDLTIAGTHGVPVDATAVTMSVTATDVTTDTFVRVEPAGGTPGSNSNVNVVRRDTVTNLVTTKLGAAGAVTLTNNQGKVHLVADLVGYYRPGATGATFTPLEPTRVLDSRLPGSPSWSADTSHALSVGHLAPDPAAVDAIAANLTVTNPTTMSLATLYPQEPRPGTSNLLFSQGQTLAAAATSGVAPDGTVSLYNQLGLAQFVLDVSGYFTVPS